MAAWAAGSGVAAALCGFVAIRRGVLIEVAAATAGLAWAVQAAAIGWLISRLRANRDAMVPWLSGVGVRGGLLMAGWVAASLGWLGRPAVVVFGLTTILLLMLEAIWLARTI